MRMVTLDDLKDRAIWLHRNSGRSSNHYFVVRLNGNEPQVLSGKMVAEFEMTGNEVIVLYGTDEE